MNDIQILSEYFNIAAQQFIIVLLRVLAAMAFLPALGEKSVPVRVKIAAAVCFSVVILPSVSEMIPGTVLVSGHFLQILFSETLIGLILGISVRFFVMSLQIAGSIAGQSTSLAQVFGGSIGEPMPAMGHVLVVAGLALALLLGLHVKMVIFLIMSYHALPLGLFIDAAVWSQWATSQVTMLFSLAFTLAVPFLILTLLYNVTLGVINRAMPQLMVVFVGAPLITFSGLFLLFLVAPVLLSVWTATLDSFFTNPFGTQR